jgi:hypothetical protein
MGTSVFIATAVMCLHEQENHIFYVETGLGCGIIYPLETRGKHELHQKASARSTFYIYLICASSKFRNVKIKDTEVPRYYRLPISIFRLILSLYLYYILLVFAQSLIGNLGSLV